jgi:hypothetical protein
MSDEQNTKSKDGWIEAGSVQNETWKPESEGDEITGIYTQHRENIGMNKSHVYLIQEDDKDEPTAVWGSTVLDARFEEIPELSQVSIEYLGEVKGKGPKPYKNFRVFYKRPNES